jgi:hypothetical protein
MHLCTLPSALCPFIILGLRFISYIPNHFTEKS